MSPDPLRLSQVSRCPGSGWRRRAQGGPRTKQLSCPTTPALCPGGQSLGRLARAARDAPPAASGSRGASPDPWLPRPALSLRHPHVLRHFSGRQGGREERKRPSVCTQPLPQHKKRRRREAERRQPLNCDSTDKENHRPQQKSPGYTHPAGRWGLVGVPPRPLGGCEIDPEPRTKAPVFLRLRGGQGTKETPTPYTHTSDILPLLKVCMFAIPLLTPSPPV